MTNALDFHPEKIPAAEFPHPVGSAVEGSFYSRYTVVDRGGFAFVACCAAHEREGTASGWYPQREKGRMLATFTALPDAPPDHCPDRLPAGQGEPESWQEWA